MGVLCSNYTKLESAEGGNKKFLWSTFPFPLLGLELEAGLTPLRWEARRQTIRYWVKVRNFIK